MSTRVADVVAEGTRVVALAEDQGVPLRLLGGVAVRLRCPEAAQRPELARTYKDIDFAAPRRTAKAVRELLTAQSYVPNSHFNALHGAARLLFYDEEHGRQVDVFLGTFEMCHKLDLEPRFSLPGPALPPADLLLLKLQIVQLNEKDVIDALTLLLQYEPVPEDGPATLSSAYIARLCAGDWGWYTTLHDNLETVRARAPEIIGGQEDAARVQTRIDALLAAMEAAPKSVGWRLRDKIGRRKAWYELPEEVER
jgi:hypothetical protein